MAPASSNPFGEHREPVASNFETTSLAKNVPSNGLSVDSILGSPFFLTTISISAIGWTIAFFASIAANANSSNFAHFAWWTVIFELFVIIGVALTVLSDSVDVYRLALVGFLASALTFTTSTANTLIYSSRPAEEAAAAGHIFLSIIIWILYFGTTTASCIHPWADSHMFNKKGQRSGLPITPRPANDIYITGKYGSPYPRNMITEDSRPTMQTQQSIQQSLHSWTDAALPTLDDTHKATPDFRYKARAMYKYDANPDDPNEISFQKGEVLQIADISGKWFQARNANGAFGIAPSNYLNLLPQD